MSRGKVVSCGVRVAVARRAVRIINDERATVRTLGRRLVVAPTRAVPQLSVSTAYLSSIHSNEGINKSSESLPVAVFGLPQKRPRNGRHPIYPRKWLIINRVEYPISRNIAFPRNVYNIVRSTYANTYLLFVILIFGEHTAYSVGYVPA